MIIEIDHNQRIRHRSRNQLDIHSREPRERRPSPPQNGRFRQPIVISTPGRKPKVLRKQKPPTPFPSLPPPKKEKSESDAKHKKALHNTTPSSKLPFLHPQKQERQKGNSTNIRSKSRRIESLPQIQQTRIIHQLLNDRGAGAVFDAGELDGAGGRDGGVARGVVELAAVEDGGFVEVEVSGERFSQKEIRNY